VSRLCDRVTRRSSPGLDTDLSGLGLSFIHPGNVRFSCNTLPISSILAFSTRQIHLSSVTGSARNPLGSGKPFGVRQTTPPAAASDLATTLRKKWRFRYRRHLAVPPVRFKQFQASARIHYKVSTSRVRSRQKKRLPVRPPRHSRSRSWAKTNVSRTAPTAGDCRRASSDRIFQETANQAMPGTLSWPEARLKFRRLLV
jgi:hypothetical protein